MTTTKLQNALLRKNGEFIVRDQIIFQYPKAITTQQVKAQVNYLLGKKALKANVEVRLLDKNKHIFHISGPGVHSWGPELVAKFTSPKPPTPPPPPIYPISIIKNAVITQQKGLKVDVVFKASGYKLR